MVKLALAFQRTSAKGHGQEWQIEVCIVVIVLYLTVLCVCASVRGVEGLVTCFMPVLAYSFVCPPDTGGNSLSRKSLEVHTSSTRV